MERERRGNRRGRRETQDAREKEREERRGEKGDGRRDERGETERRENRGEKKDGIQNTKIQKRRESLSVPGRRPAAFTCGESTLLTQATKRAAADTPHSCGPGVLVRTQDKETPV